MVQTVWVYWAVRLTIVLRISPFRLLMLAWCLDLKNFFVWDNKDLTRRKVIFTSLESQQISKIFQLVRITCSRYYIHTTLSPCLSLLCIIISFECHFNTAEAHTGPINLLSKAASTAAHTDFYQWFCSWSIHQQPQILTQISTTGCSYLTSYCLLRGKLWNLFLASL